MCVCTLARVLSIKGSVGGYKIKATKTTCAFSLLSAQGLKNSFNTEINAQKCQHRTFLFPHEVYVGLRLLCTCLRVCAL